MTKAKQIRSGKKYLVFVAGSYVEAKCIDSKLQMFQYWCPFADQKKEPRLRNAYAMRSEIFNFELIKA